MQKVLSEATCVTKLQKMQNSMAWIHFGRFQLLDKQLFNFIELWA